jgi:membrane protein DedA with SNARE-associated domain
VLVLASISESLVNIAWHFVRDAGLPAVFVLMLAESACVPIPSEATMLFAGFSVSRGHYSLAAVVIAGTLGNLLGSLLAFALGFYGNGWIRQRRASRLLVHGLDRAQQWFDRYGSASVFFTRMLPLARTFISLPAGFARMPLGRFTLFTLLGCIPWVLAWAAVGDAVGSNWSTVKDDLVYADYAVLALAAAVAGWLILRWTSARRHAAGSP